MKSTKIVTLFFALLLPLVTYAQTNATAASRSSNSQGEAEWTSFWEAFRTAVQKRDRVALKKMMASTVRYENELEGTPNDLFNSLDAEKGDGWRVLQGAIAKSVKPYRPVERRPGKKFHSVTNPMPCSKKPCGYSAMAVFALGSDNRWRWTDFLYIEN